MVLCVAGDVDPSEIISIAKTILPSTTGSLPQRDPGIPEALTPVRYNFSKAMDVSLPIFFAGSKSLPPAYGHESLSYGLIGAIALDILAGHSSPLYFKLYNEGLINSDFSVSFDFTTDIAYSFFGGETRDPNRVFDCIKEEIINISKHGPDSSYFNRIKKAALGSYTRSLNSFEACCSNIIDGYFRGYDAFEALDVLSAVTESDIMSFYNNNLSPENMAISVISPRG